VNARLLSCLAGMLIVFLAGFAQAASWVHWPVSQGGNDHYYMAVHVPGGITWDHANLDSQSAGGYLATTGSGAENAFVFNLVDSPEFWFGSGEHNHGPWLGGFQPAGSPEPGGNWQWVAGEPWSYTNWASGHPDDFEGSTQNWLIFYSGNGDMVREATWDDIGQNEIPISGYVVESLVPEPSAAILCLFTSAIVVGACKGHRSLRTYVRNVGVSFAPSLRTTGDRAAPRRERVAICDESVSKTHVHRVMPTMDPLMARF
jgi:hypothetical protein